VSAKTSLPSASVLLISTESPFIDLRISAGLKASLPMAFSANAKAKTIFFSSLRSRQP